jgi:Tfp pilus assembly protein PilN
MFRINLLPKEVLERRRYEGWYRWVFILAVGLILIILGLYVLLLFEVSSKNTQLQTIKESATQQTVLAEQLSIFQNKEQELQARQQVAQTALASRVNVGQVAEDVSLVLPDEVWLDLLTINENTGIVMTAETPRNAGESNDVAYKSVAKTLVRLNELPELYDVWLTTASNGQWQQWAPSTNAESPIPVNVVTFGATTKVVKPAATAAAPGAGSPAATATTTPAAAAQGAVNAANSAGTQ